MTSSDVTKSSGESDSSKAPAGETSFFAPLMELRHRMDELFDNFLHGGEQSAKADEVWPASPFARFPYLSPMDKDMVDVRFDVTDGENAIEVSAELPGMDEKDVELSVADGVLSIKGEKKTETEEKKKNYYCKERRSGSFVRMFRIPDSVDVDQIKASFDKGVLEVELPKRPDAKAKVKKIDIGKKL